MGGSIKESITLIIAFWGAITGTIALWLRYKEQKADRPNLVITPSFKYGDGSPPAMSLVLKFANKGRRPVTIDSVIFQTRPPILKYFLKWYRHGKRHITVTKNPHPKELTEGKSGNVTITKESLPSNLNFTDFINVFLKDQTGKLWSISKWFSKSKLKTLSSSEALICEKYGDEKGNRFVELNLYRIGIKYQLKCFLKDKEGYKERTTIFTSRKNALGEYKNLSNKATKYVQGDIKRFYEKSFFEEQEGERERPDLSL